MAVVLDILGWVGLLGGIAFILVGTLGLLRLPDIFCRMHGAGMTDTLGALLVTLGMMTQSGDWLVVVKLAIIWLFIAFTSPITSHALAQAALHGGVKPWARLSPAGGITEVGAGKVKEGGQF